MLQPAHYASTARQIRAFRTTPRFEPTSVASCAMVIVAQRCIPDARERFRALLACGKAALFDPEAFDNIELHGGLQRRNTLYKLVYLAGACARGGGACPANPNTKDPRARCEPGRRALCADTLAAW